ncbi:MAG: peptidase [Cyanobacteria bacterium RYN_339]|nr:peptidase [Cyanobacteria bacterium RYN_339]
MPDTTLHAMRRKRFMDQMEGGAALIPTHPERIRSRDTDHRFRPDSDFYYLTGFKEPGAMLLLLPGHPEHEVVLFLRPRDPLAEVWHGRRLGVERAPAALGVDAAFSIDELEPMLRKLLAGSEKLFYQLGDDRDRDDLVLRLLPRLGNRHVQPPSSVLSPGTILHEMRLCKDAQELDLMRKAAAITAQGYERALPAIRPGGWEYEVQAALESAYRWLGGDGPAYNSIVAGGDNATILHYNENDMVLNAGELLLIDSGAEYGYYACDVTRTYPISGRFSDAQRAVYEVVLKAQLAAIAEVRLGNHVKSYHLKAVEVLTQGLVDLGLLKGASVEALIADESYRKFYMHGTGHYLGLDTHDVGRYKPDNNADWRPMAAGMVVTVEPGLYIAIDAEGVDPAFRGIGIRIEDDILVTPTGNENFTQAIAKSVTDVEAALAHAGRTPALQ